MLPANAGPYSDDELVDALQRAGKVDQDLFSLANADDALRHTLKQSKFCGLPIRDPVKPGQQVPFIFGPAAVPILVALAGVAVDLYVDKRSSELEKLKSSSMQGFDLEVAIDANSFQNARCIIIERQAKDEKKPGLLVVLLVHRQSDYITLQPVFIRARDSIATTAESTNSITVSTAVAINQIAAVQGVTTVAKMGQAATTVDSIALSEKEFCTDGKCISSPIIPLPTGTGTVVIGIGVVETGDVGFSISRAQAEIAAIKGALGPAAAATVQGHFDREFAK